jgi:hypothetical protein
MFKTVNLITLVKKVNLNDDKVVCIYFFHVALGRLPERGFSFALHSKKAKKDFLQHFFFSPEALAFNKLFLFCKLFEEKN